jgi:hypothetical protein
MERGKLKAKVGLWECVPLLPDLILQGKPVLRILT